MEKHVEQLKKHWQSNDLTFIATLNIINDNHGYFHNFINPINKEKLFYPVLDGVEVNDDRVSFLYGAVQKLATGNYYKVALEYTNNPKGKNNPYSLRIKGISELDQEKIKIFLTTNPQKDHIRLRFERLSNPEANKIIANLMREIGKGMYSSKQRMIFELLQNADDAPGKENVEFHIDVNGDYLFVMHDGAPFDKDDIDAITSAAESTKRRDKKKTGYKGIGFKSVFTDSTEVWLKSGNYQFAFIRNSPLFEDFESFYFSSSDYKEFPKLAERHRIKYQKDILSYNSSTDIPWQIIPIWQDRLPREFNDSNFNYFNNPVQFALKVGTTNIYSEDGYLAAIENIIKRPQFLLFLRNTSKFRSTKNRATVKRIDDGHIIKIERSTVDYIDNEGIQKQEGFEYTKQVYSDIKVTNESFSELNIGIQKILEKNDLNEDTYYFVDLNNNKIETIPPKLASATETEISFGIALADGIIKPEQQYIESVPKYSSLFTYLPMEDTRFQLPFLVNADFVPSSDRQKIQGDNPWNKYIMIKVAEKHIETLCAFAKNFLENHQRYNSYLSLLLKNYIPNDDTAQQIISSYNKKYQEELNKKPIVTNDLNEPQLISQTIIDDSGIVEMFGCEVFYEIIETKKRLPHSELDVSYLKNYKYLDVEIVGLKELAKNITPELSERLGRIIAEKSIYNKPELLDWLNKIAEYMPENFGKIPFIVHNRSLFSIDALLNEPEAWVINKNTIQYEDLIKHLGYNTIDLQLEKYKNISNYLLANNGYINNNALSYERIAINNNLPKLEASVKIGLIDFLQSSEFMKGIGSTKYFDELKLFVDDKGTPRPLHQLLNRQNTTEANSILQFRISEKEYNALTVALKKELIHQNKVFTSFILNKQLFDEWSKYFNSQNINEYNEDLKKIFSWKEESEEILQSQWASIAWLYIDDETRFTTTDKVYWSNAFNDLSADNYRIIKSILHIQAIKTLPLQACGDIIQSFKLKTDNAIDIDWTKVKEIEMIAANTLLDWMENDGSFNNFLKEYTLIVNKDGFYKIQKNEDIHIYDGSEKELNAYIQTHKELSALFIEFDKRLCCESRNKIGLLQGDKLLKVIIDSGAYEQSLAIHLPVNISIELLQKFISNLESFNLKTGVDYNSNSPEHLIINQLLKNIDDTNEIPTELQNTIELLRGKITINDKSLSNYNISDRVSFGIKEDKKVLRLSDILSEFQGDSDELEKVKESLTSITQKEKLRKLIFKTIPLKPEEIHSKIEMEASPYYSVHQVVFQLLDKKQGGRRKWAKQHFDDYYNNSNDQALLKSSYQLLLDILLDIDFTELTDFNFHNLVIDNCVDKNFAIESEFMPEWLENWVDKDQSKRLEFIYRLRYNGLSSPIVKLRKAIVLKDYDQNLVIRYFEESKANMQIIWNTILWLSKYSSEIITKNIDLIKQINNYVTFNKDSVKALTIPVIEFINEDSSRNYTLKPVSIDDKLHVLNKGEGLSFEIFNILSRGSQQIIFVDDSCGKQLNHFKNKEEIRLTSSVNADLLDQNSKLWDEPFYRKWEHFSQYPICIYDGSEIPYKQTYNNTIISTFTDDLKAKIDSRYYVSKILIKDILNNLPSSFPNDILENLKNWHYKTLQDESLLDEDSFQYKESIDRLLQDRLGISHDKQKEESANAKIHAVYFLEEEGYDVFNVSSYGAALTNIIDPDGNLVKCIVRSAKGGLLYLDKEHWEMLENNDTHLVVIYPGNSPRLFRNRLELLEDELAENVLFRVPNSRHTTEIDDVFDALESESHLILVTSEKMKRDLFSQLRKGKNMQETDVAISDDNFNL